MPVHTPGRRLLHQIPLKFVHDRVAGGGRKGVDTPIALVPFIDFLIVLVIFLLMSFSASGELLAQKDGLKLPSAAHVTELQIAPIIAVDHQVITLDQQRVADTASLMDSAESQSIDRLVQDLETMKRNWNVLHPNDPFEGTVVMQADVGIDFRVLKKIMLSVAQAGYPNVSFAVNEAGDGGGGGE